MKKNGLILGKHFLTISIMILTLRRGDRSEETQFRSSFLFVTHVLQTLYMRC